MTTTTDTIRNGIDTATLFATLDAIEANPELARFQFRARNRWIDGPHNRSQIKDFYGAGSEDTTRTETFELVSGEPQVLLGTDTGPNPAEFLLHALAGCLTTSLVYVAAARGVHLTEVTSTLEGNMDLRGALGLDDDYRNGFTDIKVTFAIKGDATEEQLQKVMDRATARSAVFDIVTNGVPVEVDVEVQS
ncbi:MAG: OsmC family protein [Acidimicrobiia bacterium]|nr:OsmC family protein [Acidimicrobiia bacterium]